MHTATPHGGNSRRRNSILPLRAITRQTLLRASSLWRNTMTERPVRHNANREDRPTPGCVQRPLAPSATSHPTHKSAPHVRTGLRVRILSSHYAAHCFPPKFGGLDL